jgi:hypothetical protein
MEDFVTIATFTYPTELVIFRGRLESEGIECFVKDEFTVQVNNLLSNAIGGIKLQVKNSDVNKAIAILKDGGYKNEEAAVPSKFWVSIDNFTTKVPLLKKAKIEVRFLILSAIILILLSGGITLLITPSKLKSLTETSWCLDRVSHDGKSYTPHTIVDGLKLNMISYGYCDERIVFGKNGTIDLPGFDSNSISGNWTWENDVVSISQVGQFPKLLEGNYKIELDLNRLTLISDKTVIYCYKTGFK